MLQGASHDLANFNVVKLLCENTLEKVLTFLAFCSQPHDFWNSNAPFSNSAAQKKNHKDEKHTIKWHRKKKFGVWEEIFVFIQDVAF